MNRDLPNIQDWLIAQCGRPDEVGTLSRLWLQECQDSGVEFKPWLHSHRNIKVLSVSCEDAEREYSEAIEKLKAGDYCDTYQHGFTLPGIRELQRKSSSFHKDHPDISPVDYLQFLRSRLFDEFIVGRKIVYLDTNYWIGMRQVYLDDKNAHIDFRKCLRVLTDLVDRKKIICPLSLPIFLELLKQTDPRTRVAMAELITVLSEGVSLRSIDELVELEIRKLTANRLGEVFPAHQIWTKNVFVAGELLPSNDAFSEDDNSWLMRSYIDLQWNIPFVEVIRSSDPSTIWPNWSAQVDAHNQDFEELRKMKLNRKDLRDREVGLAFHTWGFRDCITKVTQEIWLERQNLCIRSMKDPDSGVKGPNPSVVAPAQILGGINAVYVNAGKKRMKENDIFDSLHAAFGLPYCDIFASDSGLCHALIEGKNRFDDAYGATVCRNAKMLTECLSSID